MDPRKLYAYFVISFWYDTVTILFNKKTFNHIKIHLKSSEDKDNSTEY